LNSYRIHRWKEYPPDKDQHTHRSMRNRRPRSSIHTDHTDYMDQHLHIRMIESTRETKTRVGEFCWSRGLRQKKNKNNAILIRSHRLLEIELLGHAIDLHAYRRAVVSLDPLYFTSMRTSLWTWVSCNVVIRETMTNNNELCQMSFSS